MAVTVVTGILSILAIQFLILTVSSECLDTDSEAYRHLNDKMDILTWKIQDFVTYQTKFKNLERKVLVREQSSRNLERRLKATEAELGAVKIELGRRQRGVTLPTNSALTRRDDPSEEGFGVEEWLERERVERQAQEAKLQTSVETLMQTDEEVLKKLNNATDHVRKIRDKVSDLEAGNVQLGMELDDVRRILELVANSSDEKKGPPISPEHSRNKLNEFLKDVEELNVFEAVANHSHLMDTVGELSKGLGKLNEVTESTRQQVGTLSLSSEELFDNMSLLRRDLDMIRDVVQKEKPWEGYTFLEIGSLEEKMKSEMRSSDRITEQICKAEISTLKEQIRNVSSSVSQLRSQYEESEASRRKSAEMREKILDQIGTSTTRNGSVVRLPDKTVTFQTQSKSESTSEGFSSQTIQRSNVTSNTKDFP